MTKRGASRKQQEHAWRVQLIQKLETGEMPMEEKDRKKLVEFLVNGGPSLAALEKGGIDLPNPNKDVHGGEKKGKKKKRRGRLGANDYPGANDEFVEHPDFHPGMKCPDCGRGCLYHYKTAADIELEGNPPVSATRTHYEDFRCSGCQQIYKAPRRPDVKVKYKPSAFAAVALWKYAMGSPFKRTEQFQELCGVPLPDATQYELVAQVCKYATPIFKYLEGLVADADVIQLDDTGLPILSMIAENKKQQRRERIGMHTTAVVAWHEDHEICLYYSGRKHAGENLEALLEKRSKGKRIPIQMGDASVNNTKHKKDTIKSFCNSHAVRKFKNVQALFPEICYHILSSFARIFANDQKNQDMDPQRRLAYHQKHSKSVMDKLHAYFNMLFEERIVEPNSSLGNAITYMLARWDGFCRFLHIPGAPIDNNIVERALKLAIRLRKNAMFFKTAQGALVGAILFSLIATTMRAGANPFKYLIEILTHKEDVKGNPQHWMPWNYCQRLEYLKSSGESVDEAPFYTRQRCQFPPIYA